MAKESQDEAYKRDLVREVLVLVELSHPCIVALHGAFTKSTGELSYFDFWENNQSSLSFVKLFVSCTGFEGDMVTILEYCGGGDLVHFYRTPEFTELEFTRVCLELLSAVCYLHRREIAHCSLEPSNVRMR